MATIMSIEYLENLVKEAHQAGKSIEGSADASELAHLASLAKTPNVSKVGEVGFIAGLSSYSFLEASPDVKVYSFDIGEYDYVTPAKQFIDQTFPDRHVLTVGDSLETLPQFYKDNPALNFDIIFVDGSHDYEVVKADLLNMRNFAHQDTVLVIDDLTPWKPWGVGPTKAWSEMIDKNIVRQDVLFRDGERVQSIEPPGERSWAVGAYIFE
ncbi:MAG: class I SAM-dependent methyltransferase [Candidatus Saccharibacteria bacterium]|nr:class I SAM-dependent methyltransferase [Candidatus Saccharibacteria bacterium]